ncbi:MAG: pilus assembly protein PilB [Nostoc sp. LLA-1]|nr:pilus assembly protein PilB [Cyanocohniella sp. LLY]
MLSSEGKPTDTKAHEQQLLHGTSKNWEQRREQVFQLIDNLLSFEVCLYHQIVPFGLADNKLLLGMVDPQDSRALDYLHPILSHLNCTIAPEELAYETHRNILSAYLNYKNTSGTDTKPMNSQGNTSEKTATPQFFKHDPNFPSLSPSSHMSPAVDKKQTEETSAAELLSKLTVLQVEAPELFTPVEVLATLAPKKLLKELLGRVLGGGIGRLYFERQPYQGRIIWSDNGVLQSVLENLPLSVFQGVLNELKRFASLPVSQIAEPKQVEKECLYQQNRLLLRLRVMPGMYGEEATLQVLRGAALKFYQQQQLSRLSRDALGISQQLSLKLQELHQRLLLNPSPKSEQLEAVEALNKLVKNLDKQIKILTDTGEIPKHN